MSFISLLPLKATLPFGTRIKEIKETCHEKEQSIFFFPAMGVLYLNRADCMLHLAHFPGSDLAYLGAWHVSVEACCPWKFIAISVITQLLPCLVRTQTLLLRFQSPNTSHTLTGTDEKQLWKGNFQGIHGNRRQHSWMG